LNRSTYHTFLWEPDIIIIIIFICSDKKIHDANKEHMIKPEQDSKVEKTTLTAALE